MDTAITVIKWWAVILIIFVGLMILARRKD
jgi:hypothetical protein